MRCFSAESNLVREQKSGDLEALLATAFAKEQPRFRAMSWEADTVYEQFRDLNFGSWADQFDAFARFEGDAEYRVSWVDCFATGPARGRGLFHAASHTEGPPATFLEAHQALPSKVLGIVPKSETWRALKLLNNRLGMRLVNAAKYAAGRHIEHGKATRQSLVAFSFLLDYSGAIYLGLLGFYAWWRRADDVGVAGGFRDSLWYLAGALPGIVILWTYQYASFGHP